MESEVHLPIRCEIEVIPLPLAMIVFKAVRFPISSGMVVMGLESVADA
jgi:hypothetical protein